MTLSFSSQDTKFFLPSPVSTGRSIAMIIRDVRSARVHRERADQQKEDADEIQFDSTFS